MRGGGVEWHVGKSVSMFASAEYRAINSSNTSTGGAACVAVSIFMFALGFVSRLHRGGSASNDVSLIVL